MHDARLPERLCPPPEPTAAPAKVLVLLVGIDVSWPADGVGAWKEAACRSCAWNGEGDREPGGKACENNTSKHESPLLTECFRYIDIEPQEQKSPRTVRN
jgi:hypothetical protein